MKEFGEAIRAILEIINLSFLISGAVAMSALAFFYRQLEGGLPNLDRGWHTIAALIVLSYAAGLVCFTIGRSLRRPCRRCAAWRRRRALEQAIATHGLEHTEPFASYTARGGQDVENLYTRLWAEIRQDKDLAPSFSLLEKYWTLAATCDGLVAAFLGWAGILAYWGWKHGLFGAHGWRMHWEYSVPIVVALIAMVMCCREGRRYTSYQERELIATLAFRAQKPAVTAAAGSTCNCTCTCTGQPKPQ